MAGTRDSRAAARSFQALSYPGGGGYDVTGLNITADPEVWVFARITAQPDGSHTGYSGVEQLTQPGGGWADTDSANGLRFDNGTDMARPRFSPLFAADGSTSVAVGAKVIAFRGYQNPDGDPDTPGQEWLFFPVGGAANVKKVRITSWACVDHAGVTACDGGPSPHCYYPGILQTLTCAGWDDGTDVWVVFTLENMLTPVAGVGGAPPTLVVVDGNTRVEAQDEGFTYAPDNGGTTPAHPNNGESRPVWSSAFYAALVAISCVGSDETGPLGGESS